MHARATDKKIRLQGSCDACKRKKVRCDSAKMPGNICSSCLHAGITCTHTVEKRKRGPRAGTSRKQQSESVQAMISAVIAEPDTYPVPDDHNLVRGMLLDLAHLVRSLERQLSQWRRTLTEDMSVVSSPAATTPDEPPSSESDSDPFEILDAEKSLAGALDQLSLDAPRRHYGKSGNVGLLKTAVDIQREVAGEQQGIGKPHLERMRPEFWNVLPCQRDYRQPYNGQARAPLVFPDEDLLQSLLSLYFIHIHPYVPVLHRPSFLRAVSNRIHLRDYSFGVIVLGVCSLASRYSQDPRTLDDGSEHSSGWPWYKQLPSVATSFSETPTLSDMQHCCLSTLYLFGSGLSDAAWAQIGLGIRRAQEVGAHRKKRGQPRTVQSELWTRLFWIFLDFDMTVAISLGRPRATTEDDFDLDLPVECDDEYWEHPDPTKAFVQPQGAPSSSSFFIHYVKLFEIAGSAQRMLYSVKKSDFRRKMGLEGLAWDQKTVTELDFELNQWASSLPEHLKWDPNREDGTFLRQSMVLQTAAYWTQIHIHKQFIPRPNRTELSTIPSLAICTNAARCCIRIMDAQDQRSFQPPLQFVTPIFSSAIVLLVNIWRSKRSNSSDANKDMQDVNRCMQIISSYEKKYQRAGRLADIIYSVISAGNLHLDVQETKQDPLTVVPDLTTPSAQLRQSASQNDFTMSDNSLLFSTNVAAPYAMNTGADLFAFSGLEGGAADPQTHSSFGIGTDAIPVEDWSFFMENVDELLQSIDSRPFELGFRM